MLRLTNFLAMGGTLYERLAGYPELERLFQETMAAYTRLAPKVLEFPELSLDAGGGDGSNAMRLCERFPSLRVTILDIPSGIQIARESVDGSEFAGRISFKSADMFVDPWPAECDAILFSHVVEIFSPEKIRALYAKAYSNLPKGGTMFVWTLMSNDSETGALQAAKSSIYFLAAASDEGMAYPGSDHERLIREVGFTQIRHHSAEEVDHGGLIAIKWPIPCVYSR
jgi:cyclopropane fatty-acyl-phospholipid synthase-like methyltransferase